MQELVSVDAAPENFHRVHPNSLMYRSGNIFTQKKMNFVNDKGIRSIVSLLNGESTALVRALAKKFGISVVVGHKLVDKYGENSYKGFFEFVAREEVQGKKLLIMCDDGVFTSYLNYVHPYLVAKGFLKEDGSRGLSAERLRKIYSEAVQKARREVTSAKLKFKTNSGRKAILRFKKNKGCWSVRAKPLRRK